MNLSRAVLVVFFVFFLTACVSHRNTSIIDPGFKLNDNSSKEDFMKARGLLAELALRNFSLAVELGRLPEVQAANTPSIPEAIQHLIRLYDQYPGEFQKALDQMFSIGLPQYRRYNTPLQALFWLAEDEKVESARKIVKKYQLIDLLRLAWDQDDIINQPTDHSAMEKHKKRWGHFNVVIDRLNSPEFD